MRLINADALETHEVYEGEWVKVVYADDIDNAPPIDIKTAADEAGYYLTKKERYEKFLPCTCGHNKRSHWSAHGGYFYRCNNCWKKGPVGKTDKEARHLWNEMIRKEMENGN